MVILKVALHALRTQPPLVKWEFLPWLKSDHAVVFDEQFDAALHPTEAAMSLHNSIRFVPTSNALWIWKIQAGAELGDDVFNGGGKRGHIDLSEIPPRLLSGFEVGFSEQGALALWAEIEVGSAIGTTEIETELGSDIFEIINLKF